MKENSRIRFNPVTKEIEVEGSESFVKTYFDKLQAMMTGPFQKTAKAVKTAKPVLLKKIRKTGKKVSNIDAVVSLIQGTPEGISTAELKQKTGLNERQIWGIVTRASKEGKILKMKRGVYGGAATPYANPVEKNGLDLIF